MRLNNYLGFRQRPTCPHCKKMGHVMSDCWRLRQNQSCSRGEIDTQRPVAAASLPPDKGKFQATVPLLLLLHVVRCSDEKVAPP